jgi:two-component system, LytTR family, response regulator
MSAPPPRLRVYLVDDEPVALRRLARLLSATGRAEVVGSASDPEAALRELAATGVDALFLDIEMPGLNGFELLARLTVPPPVVFTTAYDQYALRAFEVYSVDYLLKPIEAAGLGRALEKLERARVGAGGCPPELRRVIEELAAVMRGGREAPYLRRVPSRAGGRIQIIDLAAVTHFFAADKLTFAATVEGDRKYVVDGSVAELERRLDPRQFVRVRRGVLLNLDYVAEVHGWFAGRVRVRLKDGRGTELVVARDRVRALKELLGL